MVTVSSSSPLVKIGSYVLNEFGVEEISLLRNRTCHDSIEQDITVEECGTWSWPETAGREPW